MQTIMKMTRIQLSLLAAVGLFGGCLSAEPDAESEQAADTTPDTAAISSDLDTPADGGTVELPATDASDIVAAIRVNVGGGIWDYGRRGTYCWSHYWHPSKRHSASVSWGRMYKEAYAGPRQWANVDVYNNRPMGMCYPHWQTY